MKRFLTCLAMNLALLTLQADAAAPKSMKYVIREREYRFSNYFEFTSDEGAHGVVVKKRFAYLHLTNHYDVYDRVGQFEAQGASRLFSLGSLYSWGTEIDIYNSEGRKIGLISGRTLTTAASSFNIYEYDLDGYATLKAIAFMDGERRSFSLLDANNDKVTLATLTRHFVPNMRDHWECQLFDQNALNPSIIKVFAAFAVDHQEYFREDT